MVFNSTVDVFTLSTRFKILLSMNYSLYTVDLGIFVSLNRSGKASTSQRQLQQ